MLRVLLLLTCPVVLKMGPELAWTANLCALKTFEHEQVLVSSYDELSFRL